MTPIIYLDTCKSTNDDIESFILMEPKVIFSLYTFHQTKGRGQYGNSWETSKNLNLAYTIALSEDIVKVGNTLFNFHTSNVMAEFFANLTNLPVEIKWPNDLIITSKKVAGILIEKKKIGKNYYYIVGVGINVLQEKFANLPDAGSLYTQTKKRFDLHNVANLMHEFLSKNLNQEMSAEIIWRKVERRLFRKNLISVFEVQGVRQNGIIKSIDEEGRLCVDLEEDGLRKFRFKEINLLY
jgi:BirA family biotin operon repressor/biotin-[acetyl-CoA-carboxylase] ligase